MEPTVIEITGNQFWDFIIALEGIVLVTIWGMFILFFLGFSAADIGSLEMPSQAYEFARIFSPKLLIISIVCTVIIFIIAFILY
jgi:hypothetical protein